MMKNFRFYDNRQKYLLFVTTTNEKNIISDSIYPYIRKIKPTKPALKIFDAGMGDGTLLMNVMRQCHLEMPNIPLLVSTKEISMEDVRLGLEKLPDRFIEHKNTVFIISNLNYSEAAFLKSNNRSKQKKINWKIIKLKGSSSMNYSKQLRSYKKFFEKKWETERNPISGNPIYKEPSVVIIYRKDREFVLKDIIPNKKSSALSFDLIIASQPYRSRVTAEKKVKFVVEPMIKALAPKGKLIIVHACGKDPGNKIIKKIWPNENPFPTLSKSIINYIKSNISGKLLKQLIFRKTKKIRYILRALPNELSGGIATSAVFSAWNAAIYVNQIDEDKILKAEKRRNYINVVKRVLSKNKGLHFNNEFMVIEKK